VPCVVRRHFPIQQPLQIENHFRNRIRLALNPHFDNIVMLMTQLICRRPYTRSFSASESRGSRQMYDVEKNERWQFQFRYRSLELVSSAMACGRRCRRSRPAPPGVWAAIEGRVAGARSRCRGPKAVPLLIASIGDQSTVKFHAPWRPVPSTAPRSTLTNTTVLKDKTATRTKSRQCEARLRCH
jgi:hypothetical protein